MVLDNEFLKKGNNTATLHITGKTNGKEISYTSKYTVNALLADIELYDDNDLINFASYKNRVSTASPLGGLGYITAYTKIASPKIKNIGNVDITINLYSPYLHGPQLRKSLTIAPGEIKKIPYEFTNWEYKYGLSVEIDSNNTIINYNKIIISNDGSGYFVLRRD